VNLRLRLIVVFFLLSVVPVGAVTYYTYASNAQAIRDAASSEAAQLAGELSQRMRTVTTQLSQRVETLMELPAAEARTASVDTLAAAAETRIAAADSRAAAAESKAVDKALRAAEKAVRSAAATTEPPLPAVPVPVAPPPPADVDLKLGDFAELLKNIEVRGMRPGRRFSGPLDARVAGRPDGGGFVPPIPPVVPTPPSVCTPVGGINCPPGSVQAKRLSGRGPGNVDDPVRPTDKPDAYDLDPTQPSANVNGGPKP